MPILNQEKTAAFLLKSKFMAKTQKLSPRSNALQPFLSWQILVPNCRFVLRFPLNTANHSRQRSHNEEHSKAVCQLVAVRRVRCDCRVRLTVLSGAISSVQQGDPNLHFHGQQKTLKGLTSRV